MALVVLAAAGAWLHRSQAPEAGVLFDAPSFALTDQLGRPVRSDDIRGKGVVAAFVYTSCPDVCPLVSARMADLQARLRQEGLLGTRVELLPFSVDPARDTPPALRRSRSGSAPTPSTGVS